MDKIKLYLDEDVHAPLSMILNKRGFDVIHAQDVNRKSNSDLNQLEYAIGQNRCIVSFNVKDFVLLHNNYIQQNKEHCGIIISKQLPIGETLHKLLLLLQQYPNHSVKNEVIFLSNIKINH